MANKLNLNKCEIEYNGVDYSANVQGDDEKGSGGLWDMAGAFAENLCNQFEERLGNFRLALPSADETVQEAVYNLVKYDVLRSVKNYLNKQNQSEM